MDIRIYTGIIIRKHGQYLQGTIMYSTELRWTDSPWNAWRTRDREEARKLARKVGGTQMLFNPVAGQLKYL